MNVKEILAALKPEQERTEREISLLCEELGARQAEAALHELTEPYASLLQQAQMPQPARKRAWWRPWVR